MSYELNLKQYKSIIENENDIIAILSNTSAFLYEILENVNWVGFYLMKDKELVLGPFQGKIACYRIPITDGVCGYVARNKKSIIVPDVEKFDGHIACDSNSKSEIVIPILKNGEVFGVLDVDSYDLNNFSILEQNFLEELVDILVKKL